MHLPTKKIKIDPYERIKTDNWFCDEVLHRKRTPVKSLEVWWHCANMPGSAHIIEEQLALINKIHLPNVHAVVLGENIIKDSKIKIEYHSNDFGLYENPTLQRLWESARNDPDKGFIYFHTKGASSPFDAVKANWRKVMTEALIMPWRANYEALNENDLIGCNWQNNCHFPGNFWMARGDWISHLDSPEQYRAEHQYMWFAGQPWNRMHAECWIGSRHYHAVKSLLCMYEWWESFARRGMK